MAVRTQQVCAEVVLGDVLEQCVEDGQQGHGGVVDDLGHALHLATLGHLAQLQVFHRLLQVLRCVLEECPHAGLHQL